MATKNVSLDEKSSHESSSYQYSNLNLNQNHKCSNFKHVLSKSIAFDNSRKIYDFTKQAHNRKSSDSKLWNKGVIKDLKAFKHFTLNDDFYEENVQLKKKSSINNSTLSLHIEAYENSVEATEESDNVESEKTNLINKFGISKQAFSGSSMVITNPFEFPRQQKDQSNRPEIMQFKASQKLRNPNKEDAVNNMSAKPIKLLCVGDVNGRFQELLKRVKLVSQKSGNFDILLCVGEFFGPDVEMNKKVASGEIQFPIPTYVLGPCCPSTSQFYPDENAEFSPNLTYLGRKGILNTAHGLTIAYVSGIEATNTEGEAKLFEFNEKTIDDLLLPVRAKSGFLGVDVLLSAVWPDEVSKFSTNVPATDVEGSKLISRLATGLKPRYHFSGRGCHYERTPYRNHRVLVEAAQHTTRFIGLSSVGNLNKEKWMYAVSLVPMRKLTRDELTAQPPTASEFPYMEILQEYLQKRREAEMRKPENQFFFDMNADPGQEDTVDRGGRKRRGGDMFEDSERPAKQNIPANNCWFCLSNVGTEKHLIVSVGNKTYAAMPKGPLVDDHIMVMSINHVQSLTAADDELRAEIVKYRDAFSLMADANGKVLVAFERNYKCSHLLINFIPIPKAKAKGLRLQFLSDAQDKGIEMEIMEKDTQVWDVLFEGQPYFYVELPDGSRLLTKQMKNFPLQFGREVLAGPSLLNCAEKADWKNCKLGEEEEAELANQLKQRFKPYDFAADSDSDDD